MKSKEATEPNTINPINEMNIAFGKCYLDMDGLLANLFDFVAQTMHQKPYNNLTKDEKLAGRAVWEDYGLFRKVIGDVEEVFATLPSYKTNTILLDSVCEKFGGFYLCTRPTKLDYKACIRGKLSWIEEHILPNYENKLLGVVFPTKKEIYAKSGLGTPNILIDDYAPYIEAWNKLGGIGIKIQSSDFPDTQSFKTHLDQEFSKIGNKIGNKIGKEIGGYSQDISENEGIMGDKPKTKKHIPQQPFSLHDLSPLTP